MTMKSVFLDTNFLIATQVAGHEFFNRSLELREYFASKNYQLYIHPLILDEFWYVLLGLGKKSPQASKAVIFKQLEKATTNVFSFKNLILLNTPLTEKDAFTTIKYMDKYSLKPRDAMIVKIMQNCKTNIIASFDSDFDGIRGVSRIY